MDPVQHTNLDKLEPLRQAAIMAAADTGQNLQLQQAFQKDINQDLPALLLINQALAAIDQGPQDRQAEPEDTDPTQQEDLQEVHLVRVDLAGGHSLRWIVLVQNHHPVNTHL
jgi:hypothetical protein